MVDGGEARRAEIISIASGKGGTGKTLILMCLAYALQRAEHQVLLVDTDFSTDGLSLFVLGPRGWEEISQRDTTASFLDVYRGRSREAPPRSINRRDHDMSYNIVLSRRGIHSQQAASAHGVDDDEPNENPMLLRHNVENYFNDLKQSGKWDYILVDARGGFSASTVDICALSDSFILITEPHFSSFYQNVELIRRITNSIGDNSLDHTILRGVIIKKATEGVKPTGQAGPEISMETIEASYRVLIQERLSIPYTNTFPIPLDVEAVNAYKAHQSPYRSSPASLFSYATLLAFSGIFQTVTVKWPK